MKRFCTALFSAAVLLAAVLSASCSDVSSASQGGGDTAQVPGGGTAPGAGEEGSRDTIILHAQYPYIYVWESGVSGLDNKQSEMKAESDGWYYFEIKSSSAKVIFKPNADDDWSGQTEDLYAIAGEWWYNGSELSDTKPSGGQSDTKLSAPENVTAAASGSSSITVSWDAVDGADRYVVYYRSSLGTNDTYKRNGTEKTKSTENTSVLIQQLEYKCYLFWVTAENSAGESEESMWDYAMPNGSSGSGGSGTTTTLSAPTGLTAAAQSSSEITLSWNAVSGASSYNIYYGTNSSNANARLYTSSATTRCTVSSLSANTMYYFWTKACASDGTESGFSNFANARTNAASSGSGGTTSVKNDKATIYFVGSDSAIRGTNFSNIYVGKYQFGGLFTSVKISTELSRSVVDGPYKIEAGTYLLKFGNPSTGKVYNSTKVKRTPQKNNAGRTVGYTLSIYYLPDYEFTFEGGKVYTIYKSSGRITANDRTGKLNAAIYHNITAKEGTD